MTVVHSTDSEECTVNMRIRVREVVPRYLRYRSFACGKVVS